MSPNYSGIPDPAGTDSYAGSVKEQMKGQAVQKVREEHRGDAGWSHDPDHLLDEEAAATDGHRQAEQFTAAQHDRLAHGIAMRSGPQVDGANYLSIPHDKLHHMVNDLIDPGGVNDAGASWNEVGTVLRGIGDRLTKASVATEQEWSGAAAEGARAFNSGVASWSGTTGQGALLSSNNLATQSDAAGTVKSTVPPPMKYNLWDEITDLLSAPDPAAGMNTIRAKLQQQQELHQQAADAVAAYDRTLSNSSSTMPAFETPPAFDPNAHDPTRAPSGGSGPPPGHLTQVISGGGPPRPPSNESVPPGSRSSGPPPDHSPGPDDRRVRPFGSTGTDPSRADLASSAQGRHGGMSPGLDGPGGLNSAGGRGADESGFGAAPVGAWGGGPGGAGASPGERNGIGEPGARGGGEGRVPGPGAGALAAEQAAAGRVGAGAAGTRGAGGVGAMPVGAGGPGRGGEDEEHERPSYLIEENPNALFGTDEPTAPPVIE